LEFGSHQQQHQRLLAAFGAADRLPRFIGSEWTERCLDQHIGLGVGRRREARDLLRDI
jgi:hypothetical protein